MINSRKRIVVALSSLALLFIMILGISYAYYAAEVKGNTSEDPSLKLTSGYLSINYEDGTSKISGGSTSGTTTDLVYTKNFTVTNDGVAASYFGIWIKDYKVVDSSGNATTLSRPEDWTYELKSGDTVIKTGIFPTGDEAIITAYQLAVDETQNLTLTVTYDYITADEGGTDQSADMGKVLSFDINITQALDNLESAPVGTLLYAIKNNISGTELQSTLDDYGTSYYYTGTVTNNYVNYSGMCWRIVRVQGDGTIKLALADDANTCNSENYSVSLAGAYSGIIDNREDIYYTDNAQLTLTDYIFENSNIPDILSSWATTTNLDTTKLVSSEWCNDIVYTKTTNVNADNLSGWMEFGFIFAPYDRITNSTPSLKCNSTGIEVASLGNVDKKYVRYKNTLGVLTADEIALAGSQSYLTDNSGGTTTYSWTMSPTELREGGGLTYMYAVSNGVELTSKALAGANATGGAVRPSVVLKQNVTITTDSESTYAPGTQQNPYVIN